MQDGEPCMAAVDVKKCPFCEFHVAKEYKRMATVHRGGFRDSLLPTAFRATAQQQRSGGPPRMKLFLLPPCHLRSPLPIPSLLPPATPRTGPAPFCLDLQVGLAAVLRATHPITIVYILAFRLFKLRRRTVSSVQLTPEFALAQDAVLQDFIWASKYVADCENH